MSSPSLGPVVGTILLVAALAGSVVVGLRAARRGGEATTDDFVLARDSQPAGRLAWSFLASGLGAWILFAPPELGALLGAQAVVAYAVAAAAPFLVLAVVGPLLRRVLPGGRGLTELVAVRFGPVAGRTVAAVSVLYMGVFVAAELVAVGGLGLLLAGIPPAATVVTVAAATLVYTAVGGLRASLATDRWQGGAVVVLLGVVAVAVLADVADPVARARGGGLLAVDRPGLEVAATLLVAVTAANLFHHGYWQRVWAAADDRALRRGALAGAALTVPVVLVAGGAGVVAAATGAVEVPALSLFTLTAGLPTVVVAGVLALGVVLVASSVDTIENGLVAIVVAERPTTPLRHARLATVLVMVPAVAASLVVDSVLRLFLVADLLAAVLVVPALLALWRRTTTAGVVAGALGGVAGSLLGGAAVGGASGALLAVTFPGSVPTLPPFAGALVGGGVATVVVSLVTARGRALPPVGDLVAARLAARSST
jgi:solute:Na+ symporter, SSS family